MTPAEHIARIRAALDDHGYAMGSAEALCDAYEAQAGALVAAVAERNRLRERLARIETAAQRVLDDYQRVATGRVGINDLAAALRSALTEETEQLSED